MTPKHRWYRNWRALVDSRIRKNFSACILYVFAMEKFKFTILNCILIPTQDINMSKELNQSFAQRSQSSGAAIQLEVRVLQNGSWPFKEDRKLSLPQQLAMQLERFKSFYNEKHTSRKLKWLYSRSKGDLIMQGKKRFTIKVRLNLDKFQLIYATKQPNIICR